MRLLLVIFSILLAGLCSADLQLDNVPEIPDLDDLAAIKERCDKKGGAGTYDKVKKAKDELQECVKGIINVDTIKTEVEEAKKTGSMDEVFGKYCGKRPQIKGCIDKVVDSIKPCLEVEEKEALNVTMDILNQLGDFVCYRDGDRIAMFVAEGGVECIKSRVEGVKKCVNDTFKINPTTLSLNSIPNLTINKKKCSDLNTVQECVVTELEKCKDSTPANIVDALFRFIKKSACKNKQKRSIWRRTRDAHQHLFQEMFMQQRAVFLTKFKSFCEKYGPPNAFQELESTLNQSIICAYDSDKLGINSTNDLRNAYDKCTQDLPPKMEVCLRDEKKYAPELTINIVKSLITFVQSNKDKMESKQENAVYFECFNTLKSRPVKKNLVQCIQTLLDQKFGDSKAETCRAITSTIKCLSDEATKSCIRDIKLDQLREEFIAAFDKPCEN